MMEISSNVLSAGQNYTRTENTFASRQQSDVIENADASLSVKNSSEDLNVNQKEKEENAFSEDYLQSQIDEMNKGMEAFNTALHFKFHEETGIMMVRFVDKNTNEVIKEYPPEEFLEKKARIKEFIGMILDEKA